MATIQLTGLDYSKLGLREGGFKPKALDVTKSEKSTDYANFSYNKRDFEVQISGTVTSTAETHTFESESGEEFTVTSAKIRPDIATAAALFTFEMIMVEGEHADRLAKEIGLQSVEQFHEVYGELATQILQDHEIQVKFKTKKKDPTKWNFKTNRKDFTPDNLGVMQDNDDVVMFVKPGLYLDKEKGKYGWFLSLKQFDWKDLEVVDATTASNGVKKITKKK